MTTTSFVFIGGGRMAEALINGILKAGLSEAACITAVEPIAERRQFLTSQYGITTVSEASEAITAKAIVLLAVKPQVMGPVLSSIKELIDDSNILISIAAGITISYMEECLAKESVRLIRVMPNTPALVLEGASALSPGKGVREGDMDTALKIFSAVGSAVAMDERYLDAVTGLSGSGPAYVFSFIEGLIDAGVKVGLARPDAETLAMQTVLGSVKLAMNSKQHPAELRAMVTSPGGTTIAGLHTMERAGFQGIIMDAVEAATNRSKELGG